LGSALLGRPRVTERNAVADELLALSAASSNVYSRTFGLTYHATGALESGERGVFEDCHAEIARLADDTRAWYPRYFDIAYRGATALMDGRYDAAAANCDALLAIAGEDTNAINVWAAHQIALHWDTGRMAEFLPAVESAVEANPRVAGFRTGLAMAYGEVGSLDDARRLLDGMRADAFVFPRDQVWPVTLAMAIDAAARVGDAASAAILYHLLAPHVGLLLAPAAGTFNVGAADRYLGMAASGLGRHDDAVRHFETGLALEEQLRAPALATRTRLWFGRTLIDAGRREDASAVLQRCRADANALGMPSVAAEAGDLLGVASTTGT